MKISVVDLDVSNLFSLTNSLKKLNFDFSVDNTKKKINDSDCIILPRCWFFLSWIKQTEKR